MSGCIGKALWSGCKQQEERGGFPGRDEDQTGGFHLSGFPLFSDAAGNKAAAVTVEQLEEHIDHEVETKNAKSQKNRQRHRCHTRTGEVLPPLNTGSFRGL